MDQRKGSVTDGRSFAVKWSTEFNPLQQPFLLFLGHDCFGNPMSLWTSPQKNTHEHILKISQFILLHFKSTAITDYIKPVFGRISVCLIFGFMPKFATPRNKMQGMQ